MKKKLLYFFLVFLILPTYKITAQNVGINDDNSSPDPSAMLHVQSTTKGMLVPRMISKERKNIVAPATGLLVFDSETNSFWFFNGTEWTEISRWSTNGTDVFREEGNVGIGTINPTEKLEVEGMIYSNTDGFKFPDGSVQITAASATSIEDGDGDTKIHVEKNVDEDKIRLDLSGTERMVIQQNNDTGNNTMMEFKNNNDNTFIGNGAGRDNTAGSENVFIGDHTGRFNTTGRENTFLGNGAGYKKIFGNMNTYVGEDAGHNNTHGNQNTFLGKDAGFSNVLGSGNVFLGFKAGFNETGSNKLYIQNNNSSSPLIYGEFQTPLLRINGTLELANNPISNLADPTSAQDATTKNYVDSNDDVNDADADPVNELQNLSSSPSGTNRTINISDGTGTTIDIADNDNDSSNELSDLELNNNALSLSNPASGGNSIDLTSYLDNTDNQDLSLSGNTLSLSNDGTPVDLSGYQNNWMESSGNVFRNSGNVGIGENNPVQKLHVKGKVLIDYSHGGPGYDPNHFELKSPGNSGIQFMPGGNTAARFYRSQSDMDFINGDPDVGQWSTINLNNYFGSGLTSKGFLSLVIDSDNNTTNEQFTVRKDSQTGEVLFSVKEDYKVGINGKLTITDGLVMSGKAIIDVADPTNAQDAATKNYVDISDDVEDADADPNNELQSLGLNGNNLSISNGNSVDLSSLNNGDDLGNHSALQNIDLNENYLSGDGDNEGIFIDSGGKVGIGTTSPNEQLDIRGAISINPQEMAGSYRSWMTDGVRIGAGGSDGVYFGLKDEGFNDADAVIAWGDDIGDHLRFIHTRSGGAENGSEYMRIMDNGFVGIGTDAPDEKLEVKDGNINIINGNMSINSGILNMSSFIFDKVDASPNAGYLRFGDNTGWKFHFGRKQEAVGQPINTSTTGVLMTIKDNGNIGIGTTNPNHTLHIKSTNDQIARFESSGNPTAQIWMTDSGGSSSFGTVNGDFRIGVNGSAITNSSFLVNSSGNVGIGTTTPEAKLDVRGGVFLGSTTGKARLNNYDGDATTSFDISGNANSNTRLLSIHASTSGTQGSILGGTIFDVYGHDGTKYIPAQTIKNNGYVGIGTNSPEVELHVKSNSGNSDIATEANGYKWTMSTLTTGHWILNQSIPGNLTTISAEYGTGNVGIGTTNPSQRLHVIGNICYTGSISACSDSRYKTDFQPLKNSLSKISQLNGLYYYWNQEEFPDKDFSDQRQIGVIAQEVESLFPEIVITDDEGYKSVDYSRFTPILIEALKEQQLQIETLESQLSAQSNQLKTELQIQQSMIASLQADLQVLKNTMNVSLDKTTSK